MAQERDPKWDDAVNGLDVSSCGRLDMSSYDAETGEMVRYVYWPDTVTPAGRTEVRGPMCDEVAYMAARYPVLLAALKRVKFNVENMGWCPICDEHECREGNCILAEIDLEDD